jgi:uncharacterized protein (DUF697 family)
LDRKKIIEYAAKGLKEKIMGENDKSERSKHADTVIRNHVIWSMGAGLIPILVADIFAVSALQLDMIRQLCRVYNVSFQETQGKAIVTSLTSATIARLTAGSVVKMIPGLGSILGGVTVSVFAGASTYALGEVFKKHFDSGGTILDFDPARLKKLYREKFEKGKKMAEQLRKEKVQGEGESAAGGFRVNKNQEGGPGAKNGESVVQQLKDLAELKSAGVISEEEFQEMKRKLIDEFK